MRVLPIDVIFPQRCRRVLVTILAVGVVTGCATAPRPISMTCSALKGTPASPGKRIDLQDFSVQAPEDADKWCLGPTSPGRLILGTHPLMGQYIEKPEPRMAQDTLVLQAFELRHGATGFDSLAELQKFVEEWIERGFSTEGTGSSLAVSSHGEERFTTKQFAVRPDANPLALCVRYEAVVEERNNPSVPNGVLTITDYGRVCQHPKNTSSIVLMSLSERFPVGGQISPELFSSLKVTADAFFASLQF
jgi:hypothetical protein